MANATYVLWVLECGCWLVALFLAADLLTETSVDKTDTPSRNTRSKNTKVEALPSDTTRVYSSIILEAVNYNQLATFMLVGGLA